MNYHNNNNGKPQIISIVIQQMFYIPFIKSISIK